jgi:hypothetical protein
MRNPDGYTYSTDLDGKIHEQDTMMCVHCNRHISLKAFERPEDLGGFCNKCMGLICPDCAKLKACDPLEAKLDRWEKQGYISGAL